jgi:hypothetical protein
MQGDRNWRSTVHPRAVNLDPLSDRRLSRANESIRHAAPSLDAFWLSAPSDGQPPHPDRSPAAYPVPVLKLPSLLLR